MYLETVTAMFMEGIDSFVKAAKAYAGSNVPSSKGYIHCPCVDCKNEKAFRIRDIEQIRYHLLSRGFMKNYKVWNMDGGEGDNLPKETIQGPLSETTTNETLQQTIHETVSETVQEAVHEPVSETMQETINETSHDTLLDTKVIDALDKMICYGELEFLDARNLNKLEQMGKDAKTPLFNGSSITKLDANLCYLR